MKGGQREAAVGASDCTGEESGVVTYQRQASTRCSVVCITLMLGQCSRSRFLEGQLMNSSTSSCVHACVCVHVRVWVGGGWGYSETTPEVLRPCSTEDRTAHACIEKTSSCTLASRRVDRVSPPPGVC